MNHLLLLRLNSIFYYFPPSNNAPNGNLTDANSIDANLIDIYLVGAAFPALSVFPACTHGEDIFWTSIYHGDFNEIFSMSKKVCGSKCFRSFRAPFQDTLHNGVLVHLGFLGISLLLGDAFLVMDRLFKRD